MARKWRPNLTTFELFNYSEYGHDVMARKWRPNLTTFELFNYSAKPWQNSSFLPPPKSEIGPHNCRCPKLCHERRYSSIPFLGTDSICNVLHFLRSGSSPQPCQSDGSHALPGRICTWRHRSRVS